MNEKYMVKVTAMGPTAATMTTGLGETIGLRVSYT